MNSNNHKLDMLVYYFMLLNIDVLIEISLIHVCICGFFLYKNDKLIYISSPFSNQSLPVVTSNEFLFIHPKPKCLHIVYTIIQLFPLGILDFFNEFKKKWD